MIRKSFGKFSRMKKSIETNEDVETLLVAEDQELTLLSAINCIITLAEDSGLSKEFMEKADRFISYVSERQGITKIQAVMLALIIEASAAGSNADYSDIARFLSCNNVMVLQYKNDIDDMVKKGLLRKVLNEMSGEFNYTVPSDFLECLSKNKVYERKSYKGATDIQFFQHVYDITHLRGEDELSTDLMLDELDRLLEDNAEMPFVKALRETDMMPMCRAVILHMCRCLVLSSVENIPLDRIVFLFDNKHERYNFGRAMTDGSYFLVVDGWMENAFSDGLRDKEEFQLTDKARETLLAGFEIKSLGNNGCDLLQSESISTKKLFFDSKVERQLDSLAELLSEDHYKGICNRLKARGLRQGFACLFYGEPGTGKTESVLQIAQKTGRDIMQVNISQLKSMWVGESEKNVKALFDRYRMVTKRSKRVPILLFNEADAIIGKRKEGADRSVDKMENSIQNIILQEMESLEGIMIATTNLVQNMDSAFERRFLYKVKFDKPELAQRRMIWQSMMPALSDETAGRLASAYDFSGGQIENITRKCDIESILYGDEYITPEKIEQYCQEEKIVKKGYSHVGFT